MPQQLSADELRSSYNWHLRPPFTEWFCADHWWEKGEPMKLEPVVALYELARRHPRIGRLRTKYRSACWHGRELGPVLAGARKKKLIATAFADLGHESAAVHCLCLIGLKTWPQLDPGSQEYWEDAAGKLKGVDSRDRLLQCSALISDALASLFIGRMAKLKGGALKFGVEVGRGDSRNKTVAAADPEAFQSAQELLADDLKKQPFRAKEIETLIARKAIEAWRSGALLFSVVPDLTHERAAELLASNYREEQKHFGLPPKRARWSDWLPAITAFEDGEVMKRGAKARAFATYRRVVDGIEFDPRKPPLEHLIDRG